ncbi:MAG: cytochrome c [Acidobacteriia bacterium]|nr:cytochrome c [Terriglobia bacterium]
MKLMLKLALVLVLALSLSLLYAAASGDAKKGKELFTKSCVQCHGEKGEGKAAIEKLYSVKMQPLSSKEAQSKSDEQLMKTILEGSGKMKPVKLSKVEAADVVAFVRTFAGK